MGYGAYHSLTFPRPEPKSSWAEIRRRCGTIASVPYQYDVVQRHPLEIRESLGKVWALDPFLKLVT